MTTLWDGRPQQGGNPQAPLGQPAQPASPLAMPQRPMQPGLGQRGFGPGISPNTPSFRDGVGGALGNMNPNRLAALWNAMQQGRGRPMMPPGLQQFAGMVGGPQGMMRPRRGMAQSPFANMDPAMMQQMRMAALQQMMQQRQMGQQPRTPFPSGPITQAMDRMNQTPQEIQQVQQRLAALRQQPPQGMLGPPTWIGPEQPPGGVMPLPSPEMSPQPILPDRGMAMPGGPGGRTYMPQPPFVSLDPRERVGPGEPGGFFPQPTPSPMPPPNPPQQLPTLPDSFYGNWRPDRSTGVPSPIPQRPAPMPSPDADFESPMRGPRRRMMEGDI